LFLVAVSVTPKGKRPPLTSFSGIKSSRRINLSFVRLRPLISDSAAGASFLFFGVFTLLSPDISIRAKSPPAEIKAEMLATFIVEPEVFMQPIISLIAKTATPR
jgi:hypothetical protein